MKRFDLFTHLSSPKLIIIQKIFNSLQSIREVISITFVGSFCDRKDLSGISDIDVIVVCDTLSRSIFEQCIAVINKINGMDLGFPDKQVFINSSFGPLKFDTQDQIVIHLMIYDREGHRRHVLNSPFTCYDWERSQVYTGKSLKEIYPVLGLQPMDFFNARRGLEDYITDLEQKILSYRVYEFDLNGCPQEVKKCFNLDSRHIGEYAYHIIRNLISNYAKLLFQQNIILKQNDFYDFWNEYLSQTRHLIPNFKKWENIKIQRGVDFPPEVLPQTKEFLSLFGSILQKQWISQSKRVIFIRHARTKHNDGSFLGQGRNPDILEHDDITPLNEIFESVYSSPLKRALKTAEILIYNKSTIIIDDRLSEQNYGDAEGLTIIQLQKKYPEITSKWEKGIDVNFPNGENTEEVRNRLFAFLNDLSTEELFPKVVVTHNVVLRCLLGSLLGLPLQDWYKLCPAHLERFEVILSDSKTPKALYLNLSCQQKEHLSDNLTKTDLHLPVEQDKKHNG